MPTLTINLPKTTFVSSAQPNYNFSFYPLLYTGTDPNFQDCISLWQIDLSSLPVAQVISAKLSLTVLSKSGADPSPIAVNQVTSPFDTSTVTYNTRPSFSPTASGISVKQSDLYTTVQIDVTNLINEWLAGSGANHGIALTNTGGVVQFASNAIVYQPYFPQLVITYSSAPAYDSALCFSYAQLAHIIQQIILFYPANTVTVFTKGLTASSVTGTPYKLFSSSVGTYGGIFILLDNGQEQAVPLTAITAIYTGDGTVYNPSFTYLTTPGFTDGCDKDLITAIHDYLPVSTNVSLFTGSNVHATGTVYKNVYGILVLSDAGGNTPVFVPVNLITAILPEKAPALRGDTAPHVFVETADKA
ncbi:MAG TPA: DNRLRE domain-containing protein [Caproiciproducens sp.]|nr:DNRLRE domain-containing protein [Caproiciproducens sp.]